MAPMPATYLDVPFRDKDSAKVLGARWDPVARLWYVPPGRDLAPFADWLPVGAPCSDPLPDARPFIAAPPAWSIASRGYDGADSALAASEPAACYPGPAQRRGVNLSQLLAGVTQAVSLSFPIGIWTLAEVVDVRPHNGHLYLELAERDASGLVLAKAKAMIWAGTASRILPEFERATGATLAAGIKLLLRTRPIFKPQYGFSLEIDAIDPGYTLGELEARKREIRARLQREGLFGRQRLLAAPWDYRRVLVIAPEGGAGLGDFQAEAMRLQAHGLCRFDYCHSRFQGEGAATRISAVLQAALQAFPADEPPDALVLIRGGGAVNDLAWLDDYELARTLCELPVPVLTGIGHERDNTLPDEVAQQCFDTPSKVIASIEQLIVRRANEARQHFEAIANLSRLCIAQARARAQQAESAVRALAQSQLDTARDRVPAAWTEIQAGARQTLRQARQASSALMSEIAGQGPEKTLVRGFAVVRDGSGRILPRAAEVVPGQALRIEFHDGVVQAHAEPATDRAGT